MFLHPKISKLTNVKTNSSRNRQMISDTSVQNIFRSSPADRHFRFLALPPPDKRAVFTSIKTSQLAKSWHQHHRRVPRDSISLLPPSLPSPFFRVSYTLPVPFPHGTVPKPERCSHVFAIIRMRGSGERFRIL